MAEQQEPDFVILVANDGSEFVLPTAAARRSGFVTRILVASRFSPSPAAGQQDTATTTSTSPSSLRLELPDFSAAVLDVLAQFLGEAHMHDAQRKPGEPPMDVSRALSYFDPSWAPDRVFVMELLTAADYLCC